MIVVLKTTALFVVTALAEIVGCYLVFRWLRNDGPMWLAAPAMASLAVFAWLLTLHPGAAGRTYAAYGAVYVASALLWLWWVEGQRPTTTDLIGAGLAVTGMMIMVAGRPAV
ncbi:MAG: YnfA family protein [Phycisphaera sp.]|nr:YnfA family protein [Phycisphaera sp.]